MSKQHAKREIKAKTETLRLAAERVEDQALALRACLGDGKKHQDHLRETQEILAQYCRELIEAAEALSQHKVSAEPS